MILTVLDASVIGGGPVSRALECAAREPARVGARVSTLRLCTLFASCCASCGMCMDTGRCARRHPVLETACARLAESDALLVGAQVAFFQRDPRSEALLRKLVGSFAGRTGRCGGTPGRAHKHAGVVSCTPVMLEFAERLGLLPHGPEAVRGILRRAGVEMLGSISVPRGWGGPEGRDDARAAAIRLGRILAAEAHEGPVRVESVAIADGMGHPASAVPSSASPSEAHPRVA